MKKTIVALLCLVAVVSSVACGGGNEEPTGDKGISIMIQQAGYGYKWLENIGKSYEEKTGVKVTVSPSALVGKVNSSMLSPSGNNTDLYFNVGEVESEYLDKGDKAVSGYDKIFADLTDLYAEPLDGYQGNVTLDNSLTDYAIKAATYFGDGKKYSLCWGAAYNSIVYNKDLFAEYSLEVPNTTDELIALCKKIKGLNAVNDGGKKIYGFVFYEDYFATDETCWMAQCLGEENYWNFEEGKDKNGKYTADIYKTKEFYSSAKIVEDIVAYDNGYTNSNCTSYTFTQSQMKFLEGEAFMMPNGDWLEREMEANFAPGELNISFMKLPVNSYLASLLDTVDNDAELSELVSYVDGGKTAVLSKDYSASDIARVEEARKMVASQTQLHKATIPAYSDNIDGAKDFLKYLLSYDMQLVMMEKSFGNTVPLKYDYSGTDVYKSLSTFAKSKYDQINNSIFTGMCSFSAMRVRTPIDWFSSISETSLATVPTSQSYYTASDACYKLYSQYKLKWNDYMTAAGVNN